MQGDRIGPFKVIRELGEGGFGAVYLCEQSEPVRRQVAIKIIKPGMDSNAIIARFEAERQALALMDHASIARVFEAGATEEGRPYFVMEYVKGIPITEYCDQNTLSTRERLVLFAKVCDGVQHAHPINLSDVRHGVGRPPLPTVVASRPLAVEIDRIVVAGSLDLRSKSPSWRAVRSGRRR